MRKEIMHASYNKMSCMQKDMHESCNKKAYKSVRFANCERITGRVPETGVMAICLEILSNIN